MDIFLYIKVFLLISNVVQGIGDLYRVILILGMESNMK